MLIGFLYRNGLKKWTYAMAADIVAQGVAFVRFTSEDVDLSKRMVVGEFWENDGWVKKRVRFPDVIRNFEFKNEEIDRILDVVPYTLGRMLKKNDQLSILATHAATAAFIPATIDLDETIDVPGLIEKWGAAVLKPARGRLGQGIVFVSKHEDGYEVEEEGRTSVLNETQGRAYLDGFRKNVSRDYIIQQFAAGKSPSGRYFNVRVIIQKSGDGDWHHCAFPLALLAAKGTVVANREAGATNIHLPSILRMRYGDAAEYVLQRLFSAAILIARTLDDALALRADELALDMAIDDKGQPWLHEANWRGGFWFLEEDVGLYRFGGANAVRMAKISRFGINPDRAAAAEYVARFRSSFKVAAYDGNSQWRRFDGRLGIDIPMRTDETCLLAVKLMATSPALLSITDTASFTMAQMAVGTALETFDEQAPNKALPRILSSGGCCIHDPADLRSPRAWLNDELLLTGLVEPGDIARGYSLTPAFLRRAIKKNLLDLRLRQIDTFVIDGIHVQVGLPGWEERWMQAVLTMRQAIADGLIGGWGFSLPWKFFLADAAKIETLVNLAQRVSLSMPNVLLVQVPAYMSEADCLELKRGIASIDLQCIVKVSPLAPVSKQWNAPYISIPIQTVKSLLSILAESDAVVVCPVSNRYELLEYCQNFVPDRHNLLTGEIMTAVNHTNKTINALRKFARFDSRQLFRFFVDGRFHKEYRGWVGYEENESGSVAGILSAYCLMLDNFDLSDGLTSSYIRTLHSACMSNVSTKNKKSTPGEIRYLDCGINLYRGNSTLESVQELLNDRRGDGNWIFHNDDLKKTAEEFTAQGILDILKEKGRMRYRSWYPNLTEEQRYKLEKAPMLAEFYEVKHFIQKCFAERVDKLVQIYNEEISTANNDLEKLPAISRVVRNLELLHPFPDGNGRTFVAVLMNHLLLANGLLPAILWDPNIDAELSVKEFADEIARGIENTKTLLADPTAKLYGFSIEEMPQKEIKEFMKLSRDFITRLNKLVDSHTEDELADANGKQALNLHLTPRRLVEATSGIWLNTDENFVQALRFDSLGIEPGAGERQLYFCRDIKNWVTEGLNPLDEITKRLHTGIAAVVIDDVDIAKKIDRPTLFVPDVDDALYAAGTWTRKSIACKAIALVGTSEVVATMEMLQHGAKEQANIHCAGNEECKTPQVMASLANLRVNNQLEIISVATGARPNVARYRLRAITPDICVVTSIEKPKNADPATYADILSTLATCTESIKEGGLCVLNSTNGPIDEFKLRVNETRPVAIQTYGTRSDDDARLCEARFDKTSHRWFINAEVLGKPIEYSIAGDAEHLPISSLGALLALENLGCDIWKSAEELNKRVE